MHSELRAQLAFRLAGLRANGKPRPARALRPALAARHRDLASLRHGFPVVLLASAVDDDTAVPLATLVDRAAAKIAGDDGDARAARQALLAAERDVRRAVLSGKPGTLAAMWPRDAAPLGAEGELADCDAAFPAKLLLHAWKSMEKAKAARFHAEADRLVARLRDILAADEARSPEARSASALSEAVGSLHREAFDFEAMSQLIERAYEGRPLPEARRRRLHAHVAALSAHRLFAEHNLVFDGSGEALQAFRARYPEVRAFARAFAAAGLEAQGQYDAARHDALFHQLADTPLTRDELAPFPSLCVCLREGDLDATARAELVELLMSGAPVKVMLQFDDLLPASATTDGSGDVACRADAFTGLALGLGNVFVLQACASALPHMGPEVRRAMAWPGPALFSVFSGASEGVALPPYLHAAAALESRSFPCFTYDPSQALESGRRFAIDHNPQPDVDWPRHRLEFEDRDHQRVIEEYAFTAADFVASHERFAGHFMPLAADDAAVAVDAALDNGDAEAPAGFVRMVDEADALHRMAVDDATLERARHVRERWRRLQQLARLGMPAATVVATVAAEATAAEPKPAPAAAPVAAEAPKAAASDEAYIETPRCTTCEECMAINKKMFRYDDNKQAYIADLKAGTYRQLVEAAEACQVSIIHPGKPWDPNEAGLEESLARAQPFA